MAFLLVIMLFSAFSVGAAPSPTGATITSDQADYPPGSTVTLTGAGWAAEEAVHIVVNDTIGQTWQHIADVTADGSGSFTYAFSLPSHFVSDYDVTATGPDSGSATTQFTDAISIDLDQCQNGISGTDLCDDSDPNDWARGNLVATKARYLEGDSIPQRMIIGGIAGGTSGSVTLQYDTTKGDKHAFDYLTTWNRTVVASQPCAKSGTDYCSGPPLLFPIPIDPLVAAKGFSQISGNFAIWNGTITSVSSVTNDCPIGNRPDSCGDSSSSITINFTASGPANQTTDMVLAWGAHIATRADWGLNNSAVAITGSPYHTAMSSTTLPANQGNRDLQTQSAAVIFPGSITIIKQATPEGSTAFPFSASPTPLANFNLVDDGTSANTKTFSNITDFQTYTVVENTPSGWSFTGVACTVSGGVSSSPPSSSTSTVAINLQEGDNVTCTYTNNRSANDLTVTKTAVPAFTRTYDWDIAKSVDKTQINIAEGGSATFNYTVSATHDDGTDSGWAVTGKITVSNPNGFSVSGVAVTDSIDSNASCTVTGGSSTIAANGSAIFDYTCTYSQEPAAASQTNTATATWTDFGSPNTSASGTASVDWSTTTPTIANGTVTVVDDKTNPASPVTLGSASYTQANPIEFTYALTQNGLAGTCKNYTNTAKITETGATASKTVKVCVGKDLSVTKNVVARFTHTYKWLIDKSVDDTKIEIADGDNATFTYSVKVTPDGSEDSGWAMSGQITVSNPNDWQDITADVADTVDVGGGAVCTVTGGTGAVIPASGSKTFNYSCSFTSQPSYTGLNTATATWNSATYFTPTGSASGTANVNFTPDNNVNKTITVVDDKTDPLNPVTLGTWDWDDGPHTFTYSLDKQGEAGTCKNYTNTAKISETGQKDSQTVTVCVGKDLTVSKTATTTFKRTYTWGITKDVDQTKLNIADGGSATFDYTVSVTHDNGTDSDWKVVGEITVTNPNDWENIVANVGDALDTGACSVTGGANVTIPAGESVKLAYTCDPASANATKNTATATWDAATYFTPSGTASGTANVAFANPTIVNGSVTVNDTLGGSLGSVSYTDPSPKSFTYSKSFEGQAGTCKDYDNTATIQETGQSASQTVTVCVGADLTVSKTAAGTFDRAYLWQISKDADQTLVNIAEGGSYTFQYTVVAEQTGVGDSGWTLSGKITVTNPNDWQDITADVSDAVDNGGTCTVTGGTGVKIEAGKSVELSYSCSYASAPSSYSGKNTATATWDKASAFTPSGTASGSANFTLAQLGSTDKTVHVVDSYAGPLGTATASDSAPFTKVSFDYTRTESGVAGTCTDYDNTATIQETGQSDSQSVRLCVAKDLTVSKTAAASFDRTYGWDITKDVDKTRVEMAMGDTATFNYTVSVTHDGGTDGAWKVVGKITIVNPNDWQAITANVTDAVDNGGTCTVTGGSGVVVPKSGSVTLDYSCTWAAAPTSASGTNTATATWDKTAFFTPSGSASGTAGFAFDTPTIVDGSVEVFDTNAASPSNLNGSLGTVLYTDPSPKTFTYAVERTGVPGTCSDYDNTASFETNTTKTTGEASKTVTVCVGKDLTVTKTANPAFKRTYAWNIAKSVDKTQVTQPGGTAIFNYTVTVNQTGFTDSEWGVTGKITVTNPNDWQAITANVTDLVNNGGSCTVTGGSNVALAASETKVLDYTCTYTSAPSATSGLNTATATWDDNAAHTPNGSTTGTAGFSFSTPTTTVDKIITVNDTFNGTTTTLGTVTATDSTPFASKTFSYPRSVPVPANGCKSYTNTAKIVETGQSASQTITVCGPIKTGAHTIGFWQNKNGQGIITKGASVGGVCKSGTWLRRYAPFQDLSATATCAQVGAYVTNVIKNANASGASMNAMLKAQMLATALDVYFSNPALGGNKIGAPEPIGGVKIDLTKICTDLTCTSFQNSSSAFGGSPKTVLEMLAYAASQSNVGGSLWYGNVKATQELAKDAFDAINNQKVVAP